MTYGWVRRRSHDRKLASGKIISVSSSWAFYESDSKKRKRQSRSSCPECGAAIISKRMSNGYMLYFEDKKGLTKVRHPCLSRGLGLSKKRDETTLDLFEGINSRKR